MHSPPPRKKHGDERVRETGVPSENGAFNVASAKRALRCYVSSRASTLKARVVHGPP